MRLEQINYFVEIAKSGSISQAAKVLFVSQPALSSTMKDFEAELGQQLLFRTSKGVTLTPAGEKVYREALAIQATLAGWYQLRQDSLEPEGFVHICAIPAVSRHLSAALLRLKEMYPKLNVHIHDVRPQSFIQELKNSTANIGITSVFIGNSHIIDRATELDWTVKHLFDDCRFLFMSARNPLAQKELLTEEDLKKLTLIYYALPNDVISSIYESHFKAAYRVASKEDVLDLVCRNEGVFIQPYKLNTSDYRMENGQMVAKEIPIQSINHIAPVYLIHTNHLSESEQLLAHYLEDSFVSLMGNLPL